jgi:hypothetical protein
MLSINKVGYAMYEAEKKSRVTVLLTACTKGTNAKSISQHSLLFQHVLCSGSQAFWFHLPRKFSVVTETTHVPLLELRHNWQIFDHARLLVVVETCGNPMELVVVYLGREKSWSFNSLIASTVGPPCAADGRYLGAKGPPLCSKPLLLVRSANTPL